VTGGARLRGLLLRALTCFCRRLSSGGGYRSARGMVRLVAVVALVLTATRALAADVVVRQANHLFEPSRLTIKRGTAVHFTNGENVIHHAYAEGPFAFDSGDIPPGGDFAIVFDKPGHVVVRCAIHPQMRVDIDVVEE
jgi:plastocyanin